MPAKGLGRKARFATAGALAGAAALAAAAIAVRQQTQEAERRFPPQGRFVTINGVRLHYTDSEGPEPAALMLHGNGAMIADFAISGLTEMLSRRYRTVVFDRPGYGYSERPRGTSWTPEAQASLFVQALDELGIGRAILFGHSWGTLVALAMALNHAGRVAGLVLASGFYFPEARVDAAALSPPAIPVIGDVMRHTVAPLITGWIAPRAIAKMFAPLPVTPAFDAEFPLPLALRPSQIRASAEENSMMVDAAARLAPRYGEIALPAAILAGEADEIVETPRHSVRLHERMPESTLQILPGLGHMAHHDQPEAFAEAMHGIAARAALGAARQTLNSA